jgi:Lipocalin-like domain
MKMFRIMSLLSFMVLLFACKKDETKTEMLAGGQWKLTALTVSPAFVSAGVTITDVLATYPSCAKDDFQTFSTDGAYTYDEGATTCDVTAVQTEKGTWKFNADETQMTITLPSGVDTWEIKNLSSSSMTSVYKLTENGVTYTFTGTLTKK